MKTIDCKQGSTAWFVARAGIPTASEFDNVVTPEFKPRTGQGVESYLLKKVAERVMGMPAQAWAGGAAEQGTVLEIEARPWFAFAHGVEVQDVGFCTTDDGRLGCSPDGLIGSDGGLELKCPEAYTHLKYLLGGVLPPQYAAQVHGSMLVTGRAYWQFVSYNRFFPPLVVRVERDEAKIAALQAALDAFLKQLDAAHAKIKQLIERK